MNSTSRVSGRQLGVVEETLLIPLVARAFAATLYPKLHFRDSIAEAVLERLDADSERFLSDRVAMKASVMRTQWFDRVAMEFSSRYPGALCVNLGAGLDARAHRVKVCDHRDVNWVDIDLPGVARLREALIPPLACVRLVAADVTAAGWLEALTWERGRPALFMAEGVCTYLEPDAGKEMIRTLCAAAEARGALLELAFDYASPLLVATGRRYSALSKTKASLNWSLRRATEMCELHAKLQLVEDISIMKRCGSVEALKSYAYWLLTGGRKFYGFARFHMAP